MATTAYIPTYVNPNAELWKTIAQEKLIIGLRESDVDIVRGDSPVNHFALIYTINKMRNELNIPQVTLNNWLTKYLEVHQMGDDNG